MSAFLFLLVKVNLAMGMAVILVALLRRPLRLAFGPGIAYALWTLVPVAGLASLLPARVVPAATPLHLPVIVHIAQSALSLTEPLTQPLTGSAAVMPRALAAPGGHWHMPDMALLLFAGWALGAVLMVFYLALLQLRFSAAVRRREAGPAVLGFIKPRIVTPATFGKLFSAREQAAILAHERVHLARQDARINALAALLRCLCWFNPAIHLGARCLRVDQELACDASAVAGPVSRRDYAKALLKSQMMVMALPLGCNWPGSQHPLIERIALLKRKPVGAGRRMAGAGLVMLAASVAGLGAWAAQPPVIAPAAATQVRIARAIPRLAPVATPVARTSAPVTVAGSVRSDKPDAPPIARADIVSAPPVIRPAARTVSIDAGTVLAALPPATLTPERLAPEKLNLGADPDTPATATIVADTPSGATGDEDAIVCRLPQRMANGQLGAEACGTNAEWWKLAANGKDLAADGKTLIDRPTVDKPTGEGDPDAVTCRSNPTWFSPLMRRVTRPVCKTNRFWAQVIKNHQYVDGRGKVRRSGGGGWGLDYPANTGGDVGYVGVQSNGDHFDSGQAWSSSGRP